MAKFNGYVLTEKGRLLLAKGLAGGKIEFTKMQIGDGESTVSAREMTALVSPKKDLQLLSINVKGGQCELSALLSNQGLTTGFYIKELGVFAKGDDNIEILYAYNVSVNPDFIPPFNSNNIVEIEYVDTLIVDQVANITATIDPSITYITKKYADENYLEIAELSKIIGLEYDGKIQDVGQKIKGKIYYDTVNKYYYECLENNSLMYNESTKFRAISNKPISDRLENLLGFGDSTIKFSNGIIMHWGIGTAGANNKEYVNILSSEFKTLLNITAVHRGTDAINTNVCTLVKSSNTFSARSNYVSNINIYYTAIGTWK